jgi:acetolactate synthase-1/2/3 large subunit
MTTKNKKSTKKKVTSKKAPKPAGHPMKGRDILVKALENEGVTVIFGYPGGASMEIHQGLTLSKKNPYGFTAT